MTLSEIKTLLEKYNERGKYLDCCDEKYRKEGFNECLELMLPLIEAVESISAINSTRFKENFPQNCNRGDLVNIIDTDTKICVDALQNLIAKLKGQNEKS